MFAALHGFIRGGELFSPCAKVYVSRIMCTDSRTFIFAQRKALLLIIWALRTYSHTYTLCRKNSIRSLHKAIRAAFTMIFSPLLAPLVDFSAYSNIPRGQGIEQGVKIASGHGFLARYILVCQKERAISPEQNFTRRGKFCVPAEHPPRKESLSGVKKFT